MATSEGKNICSKYKKGT